MRNLSMCERDLSFSRGLGDEVCKEDPNKMKDERLKKANKIDDYVINQIMDVFAKFSY